MSKTNIIPYKRPFRPNGAFIILGIIIVYLLVLGWNYFTKEHISIYEVNQTHIADDEPLNGIIIRSEKIINTKKSGYINYYNPQGYRVGVGNVVYTIDSVGDISSALKEANANYNGTDGIEKIRDILSNYNTSFSLSNYSKSLDMKYDIENAILEINRNNLYSKMEEQVKKIRKSSDFEKVTAAETGVLSYTIDGFETIKPNDISNNTFNRITTLAKRQLQTNDKVSVNSPVYKLITSNDWEIVVPIDDNYYNKLKNMGYVKITVEKDKVSFNVALSFSTNGTQKFAILKTNRYLERYINERFLKIELNLNSASGLKIPTDSIVKKEFITLPKEYITTGGNSSGKGIMLKKNSTDTKSDKDFKFTEIGASYFLNNSYYIPTKILKKGDIVLNPQTNQELVVSETKKLDGVYCVNTGYCEFKRVEKVYENSEYIIVSSETSGGLSTYDHIVVKPNNMRDDEFINQ